MTDIFQEDLAMNADISRTYVSEVGTGIGNVSIDNKDTLDQALDVPTHDLVDWAMFAPVEVRSEEAGGDIDERNFI